MFSLFDDPIIPELRSNRVNEIYKDEMNRLDQKVRYELGGEPLPTERHISLWRTRHEMALRQAIYYRLAMNDMAETINKWQEAMKGFQEQRAYCIQLQSELNAAKVALADTQAQVASCASHSKDQAALVQKLQQENVVLRAELRSAREDVAPQDIDSRLRQGLVQSSGR